MRKYIQEILKGEGWSALILYRRFAKEINKRYRNENKKLTKERDSFKEEALKRKNEADAWENKFFRLKRNRVA